LDPRSRFTAARSWGGSRSLDDGDGRSSQPLGRQRGQYEPRTISRPQPMHGLTGMSSSAISTA